MNHRIATLKLRGTALAACGGLVASALFACGGDSTPSGDDGGGDGSTMMDSSATPDVRGDTATPMDGTSGDTTMQDSPTTMDTGTGGDARDAGMDVTMPDVTVADVTADTVDSAPPPPLPPLDLCPTLDTDWANTPPIDHANTWGRDIAATSNADSFAFALTNDCRLHGIQGFIPDGGVGNYLNQLITFTVQFMGCGVPDAGALSFLDLIPAGAQSHTFTVADLNELARLYINSVNAEASLQWATNFPPTPAPLTIDQINAIQAHLQELEAAMPGVNPSTTRYTLSDCDAGSGDAGGDATDAGDGG